MTRKEASDVMLKWFSMSENVRTRGRNYEESTDFIDKGTIAFAIKVDYTDPNSEFFSDGVVAVKEIMAMYVTSASASLEEMGMTPSK